jgi:hypothetical protein
MYTKLIHDTKRAEFTELLPWIFILQYHTEYFYMFWSARDHRQGIAQKFPVIQYFALPPQFALNENWHYPGACIWL